MNKLNVTGVLTTVGAPTALRQYVPLLELKVHHPGAAGQPVGSSRADSLIPVRVG